MLLTFLPSASYIKIFSPKPAFSNVTLKSEKMNCSKIENEKVAQKNEKSKF
jgi:hypothetical protein